MASVRDVFVRSNHVIMANYKLSVNNQLLIYVALSKLDREERVTSNKYYRVTKNEYAEAIGISGNTAYKSLVRSSRSLQKQFLYLPNDRKLKKGSKSVDDRKTLSWVQEVDPFTTNHVGEAESGVNIKFSEGIAPYLTQLSKDFTKLHLPTLVKLDNIYAMRLYEIICSVKYQDKKSKLFFSVDELRALFDLGDKYKQVGSFKIAIIDKAVNGINESVKGLSISCESVLEGKKLVGYSFEYSFLKKSDVKDEEGKPSANNINFMIDTKSYTLSRELKENLNDIKRSLQVMHDVANIKYENGKENPSTKERKYIDIYNEIETYAKSRANLTDETLTSIAEELKEKFLK